MKNKGVKIGFIILGSIILLGGVFFAVDYGRVKENQLPLFCIQTTTLKDGGTKEYLGLGYKVIDFNQVNGYDEMKIGSWLMQYNDFSNEFEKTGISEIKTDRKEIISLEKLPQNYSQEQAIRDGCFVITNQNKLYNMEKLERFIQNTNRNAEKRKEDSIRIVQYTTEGDMIITQVEYTDNKYMVTIDATRDLYAIPADRKIEKKDNFPGDIYGITRIEKEDSIEISLSLYSQIQYVEGVEPYQEYRIASYSKECQEEKMPSFYGVVIESSEKYIIVEPRQGEEERNSSDKYHISLSERNDMIYPVGTNVKVTYTGYVKETYPAQIDVINIEVKSAESFELSFEKQGEKIETILQKNEMEKYPYAIYSVQGKVMINIDGKIVSLREALLENKITMDEILQKANEEASKQKIKVQRYQDGGSSLYQYHTYHILKYHTLEGNRDVYIGTTKINIDIANRN